MSSKGRLLPEEDEQIMREAEPSDIGGSEPAQTGSSIIKDENIVSRNKYEVPEEIVQEARRRSLAKKIREDHQGEGFVIVNINSGSIIETVDNLMEARNVIESMGWGPDETLTISCYER